MDPVFETWEQKRTKEQKQLEAENNKLYYQTGQAMVEDVELI